MNLLSFLLVLFLGITSIICSPKCEDLATCSACILGTFDECQWCAAEDYIGKRCQPTKSLNKTWCNSPMSKPEAKLLHIKNDDWSDGEKGRKVVQLKPQKVTIKSASPGVPVNITISYKPAKDTPLDIYFLIDNSGNIQKHKLNLINQTEAIFEELKSYTNNVRLGLGTFVEKPVLPYANPDHQYVYTYKNHLPLTNKTNKFKNTLTNIRTGENLDKPEDLFDGLMQAMLCKNQIGWRKDGRQIIVVFTNAFYHSAGDGKMLGAFKRHNMECDENGSMDTLMDYPSVAQVNKVAKDNGYIIIFAYFEDFEYKVEDYYRELSQKISGAKYGKLQSANMAKIIKDEYVKIIEDVNFDYDKSSNVDVTIKRTCANCKAMHNKALESVATVKMVSCPTELNSKETIKIKPISLNEVLEVEVEFDCQCECEKQSTNNKSEKCSGQGVYQCGVCKCSPDRTGDKCACQRDLLEFGDDYENCRKNAVDALLCSGHGECSCGKCVSCHEGFSGPFCEYDQNACPRIGGKWCSGHGNCKMGVCECDPNWAHSPNGIKDCGCPLEQSSCIAPLSSTVCSGNGECQCGKCYCNNALNVNDTCTGRFCDKCSWFTTKRCEELEDYAYCRFLNHTNCQAMYSQTNASVIFASRTEINSPDNVQWYMANWCRVKKGDDEGILVFKYYYSDTGAGSDETALVLVIQNELDKKPPADIWVPIGSAIGSILLIGLLTLIIWKVVMDRYDAREYNQFVKKALAAGYNVNMTENPWYEPPTTTFINPAHNPDAASEMRCVN